MDFLEKKTRLLKFLLEPGQINSLLKINIKKLFNMFFYGIVFFFNLLKAPINFKLNTYKTTIYFY